MKILRTRAINFGHFYSKCKFTTPNSVKIPKNDRPGSHNFQHLVKIARDDFLNNFENKIGIFEISKKEYELFKNNNKTKEITCSIYKMSCKIDYITVKSLFKLVKEKILLLDIDKN